MSEPIIVIDSSRVREGKLEELKSAMNELVEFVEANESRPIAYNVYFSEDETRMTVFQIHPDSASMEFHMKVAGPVFGKFSSLLELATMDVYGKPSEALVVQLHQKAQKLGGAAVSVHQLHAGLARFEMSHT